MKLFLLYTFFLLFVLVSCTPRHSPVMADTQCEPPCWQDIMPGNTTKEQALQIIPDTLDYRVDSLNEARKNSQNFPQQVCWGFQENGHACGLIRDNIVQVLDFSTDEATIEEAIDKFGNPNYLHLGTTSGDALCTYAELIYSEKGVRLYLAGNSWFYFCKKTITSQSAVNSIMYFNPAVYSLLLEEGFFGNPEQTDFGLIEWTGMEHFSELYENMNE